MGVEATSTRLTIGPGEAAGMAKVTVTYELAITENQYKSAWLVYVDVWGRDFAGDDEGPGYASGEILHTFTFPETGLQYYTIKADGPTRKIPKEHSVEIPYKVLDEDPGVTEIQRVFPPGAIRLIRHKDEISARIRTVNVGWTNQVTLSL